MYRHINILLIEDNPGDAFLIKEMLRASDFSSATLLTASTLKESLNHSDSGKEIPLILLDLGLPDSDGIESVRTVRKYFPDTALNVLTGLNDKQTAHDALREGVQNYLVKGEIDSNELEEAIRYSLERHNFINKLKEANESIKLSEQKYKLLFEDNPMPMWVIDYKDNLAFIDVNEAALEHYGYTREEFLSMTSIDIRPEAEKGRYIRLHRAPRLGSNYAGIWKHIKKDGTIIDVEVRTHDINIDNKEARLVLANDVTEKLKAEEALKHREEMLSSIYDATADTIFVLEVEHGERYRFSSVNKAFQATTGVPFEMVVGKYVNEIIPKPSLDMVLARYREAIHEKKIVRWEETSDYPAGRLTGLVSIAPHFDEAGNCVRLVGAVHDITERKKSEEKLLASEARYRRLFEAAKDGILILNADTGVIDDVNPFLIDMLRYSHTEFLGKQLWEIGLFKDIIANKSAFIELKKERYIRYENLPLKTKDGQAIWVEFVSNAYDVGGKQVIQCNIRDITERKKAEEKTIHSEERYKDLVENITDLICTHDLDGRILSSNKAAENIMGFNFGPENNWNIRDILSPDKRASFAEYIATIKEKGHAEGLMKVQTSKGEIRIWEYQNTLKTDGVKVPIIRGYARDVTERKKAEEKIKQSHKELQELTAHLQTIREEERTHLAREVHDVLGQQITGLKMDITWLNKKNTDKDNSTEKRFSEMLSLADEMAKTIRKIASELRPGILDDLGLIPALEWQSSEFEKRTGIKCLFTYKNTLPDVAKTNATGIFRIYQETLTNVARHAKATKVDAAVTFEGGAIMLSIADNGKGLNPEEMKSKKTLGIVGMKERAAMMKGNLTVKTRTEGGTVVTLSVPVQNKIEI